MLKEFKDFIAKGNVLDMAIGVVIGGAFQKIVTSLVNDIILPFTSIFTGKIDFADLVLQFGNVSIKYGAFITEVINFLILAFSIFIAFKSAVKINKKLENIASTSKEKIEEKTGLFKKKKKKNSQEEQASKVAPTTKLCPYCFSEVNIQATKCPHCTSSLEQEVAKEV